MSSLRIASALAGAGLVAVLAELAHALGLGGTGLDALFDQWVYTAVEVLGCALCTWRAVAVRAQRGGWTAMAVALWAWTAGDLLWWLWLDAVAEPPFPSLADGAYLVCYGAFYVGIVLLLKSRMRPLRVGVWLDGLIGGLALAALCAAVIFEPIRRATHGSAATIGFTLAYPLADLVLLCFVIVAFGVSAWRPGRMWTMLGIGLLLTAVADAIYSYQEAAGTYLAGSWIDPLWPASMLVIGWAAWQPQRARVEVRGGWTTLALLIGFTGLATGLLVAGQLAPIGGVAAGLAAGALVVGIARASLTFADNIRLLERSRREAASDGLTGLPNRRALMRDLEAVAADSAAAAVAFFDLDGFKHYNDSFGHGAGDRLLRRLGHALTDRVAGHGKAYRLGGDEFCLLLHVSADRRDALVEAAAGALSERGEGFEITASYGVVSLPEDASDPTTVLQLADERMYAHKSRRHATRPADAREVLLQVLSEREPALHEHIGGVSRLALATARALGMSVEDCDVTMRAAELHDIGKLAIPDAILGKPGPLDAEELELMRQHTIVGERILVAAPALAPVARLVRASHERWDGSGYPDGLAAEQIPLGARIIAVCDAYDAMTANRPYRAAMPVEAALAELRRCAGTQFDPAVVAAFCGALAADPATPLGARVA